MVLYVSDGEIDAIVALDDAHPPDKTDDPRITIPKGHIPGIKLEIKKEEARKKESYSNSHRWQTLLILHHSSRYDCCIQNELLI